MRISHLCVNYGAPLYQELFVNLNTYEAEQNVFYPRNKHHLVNKQEVPYKVHSPLLLSLSTKLFFRKKRKIMRKAYHPVFKDFKPDIIHAHTLFSDGSLANYYYEELAIPFIVAFRSTDIDFFIKYKPWLKSYGRRIADNAKFIVFISPSLRRKFEQVFGKDFSSKSLLIPNGINQLFFSIGAKYKQRHHNPVELLYVGNFRKLKNVPALIKFAENSKAKLTIVGKGGIDENKVLRMVQDSNNTTYLGRIDDLTRLIEVYRNADIFIMTSRTETFGLVYIEAMSQGIPVIYSRNTGIDGFFEQGSVGYAVSPGSASEIKSGLDQIISDYQGISKNCIEQAKSFNWAQVAERYMEVYRDLLCTGDRPKSSFVAPIRTPSP